MKTTIKAVSRDILCIAKRWHPIKVRENVRPAFYVNYDFNLPDARTQFLSGSFPTYSVCTAVSKLPCGSYTKLRSRCVDDSSAYRAPPDSFARFLLESSIQCSMITFASHYTRYFDPRCLRRSSAMCHH